MTSLSLVLPGRPAAERQASVVRRFAATVAAYWQRARQRRALRRYVMEMDDHMLADLGVSRAQALFEIDQE